MIQIISLGKANEKKRNVVQKMLKKTCASPKKPKQLLNICLAVFICQCPPMVANFMYICKVVADTAYDFTIPVSVRRTMDLSLAFFILISA